MIRRQIAAVEAEIAKPGLSPFQFTALHSARQALKWTVGDQCALPRKLGERLEHVDRGITP